MIVCGSRAHLQDEAVAKVSNKLITSILLTIKLMKSEFKF